MFEVAEINVKTLQSDLASHRLTLLDVRTDEEYQAGHLDSIHIRLDQLPQRIQELQIDAPIAVICRSGGRSFKAAELLLHSGFTNVVNVAGGFKAWAQEIDPNFTVA